MKNLFFVLFILVIFPLHAQYNEPKFGKIEPADLAMTKYDKDTSASALMLFDNGVSYFGIDAELGFKFTYERHFQIKIFKKSAFEYADFRIRLYKNARRRASFKPQGIHL